MPAATDNTTHATAEPGARTECAASPSPGSSLARRRRAPLTALLIYGLFAIHLGLLALVRAATDGHRPWSAPLPLGLLDALGALGTRPFAPEERWRWLFSTLLHHDWFHLIANLLVLRAIGRNHERLLGSGWTAITWLAAALGGSVFAAWHGGAVLGASGAIMGLLGALTTYAWRLAPLRGHVLRLLPSAAIVFAAGWAWNRWLVDWSGFGISNAAHLGGWLAGLACGALAPTPHGMAARAWLRWARAIVVVGVIGTSAVLGLEGTRTLLARFGHVDQPPRPHSDGNNWWGALLGGAAARTYVLPEVGWRVEVPSWWRVLERSHGYVALGPAPGRALLQIVAMRVGEIGSRWGVPDVIVADARARHPELLAAPFERVRVDGLDAVRIDMVYRQPDGAEVEQVRYLVREDPTHWQFIFLGEAGAVGERAARLIARMHRLDETESAGETDKR